ncbi:MAG: thiamine pyrophosphate-binding protein [Campylobacteraceae bacterium]|jgi:acetolactate synthase-1/2/3 large subunit|nr:thiamine pyrophosphate-binding protein [Campylobacteraceae bacterium]
MKVADYIVDFLIKKGVTDVFGIPGEIILDFLDALNQRKDEISTHLNYHEQASAFAACGYAQASNKLGVAYATKGPGLTNMITPIVDAFCDSTPVLFISAHAKSGITSMRFENNQEIDTVYMLSKITKYATRITSVEDVYYKLEHAYNQAVFGRKGPVFIDIQADIFKLDININIFESYQPKKQTFDSAKDIIRCLKKSIIETKRPILLIGDGVRQSGTEQYLRDFAESIKIPVISSRFSQDIMNDSEYYYGFIGSHGTRYSNFILSKCDLVISLGNRLSYNANSQSFANFINKAKIIRIDIDTNEFIRAQPNTINYHMDLKILMPLLTQENWGNIINEEWKNVCDTLKKTLYGFDVQYPVNAISSILKNADSDWICVSDVGNNEFWLSYAYAFATKHNRILFSKSFGALGCSLPKAIGAYYSMKRKVLCFSGDQGLQMNLQELQYISNEKIPITIIIINNLSSGMIRSKQKSKFNSRFFHTTLDSGYSVPDFQAMAKVFSMPYFVITNKNNTIDKFVDLQSPCIVEIIIDDKTDIIPRLPKGCLCQDFEPFLDRDIFDYLNKL